MWKRGGNRNISTSQKKEIVPYIQICRGTDYKESVVPRAQQAATQTGSTYKQKKKSTGSTSSGANDEGGMGVGWWASVLLLLFFLLTTAANTGASLFSTAFIAAAGALLGCRLY
jgi:hypothetical protein